MSKEELNYVTYKQVFEKAMKLWRKYAKEYRELIPRYEYLLRKMRESGVSPLRPVSVADLKEYPQIGLFEIRKEAEAEEFLLCLPENVLLYTVSFVTNAYVNSRVRRELKGRICDYTHQLRMSRCDYKTPLAMDPDLGRQNRRSRTPTRAPID